MATTKTIIQAGKQVAKAAGERAMKGKTLKDKPESVLKDPSAQKQGARLASAAEAESAQEPGNPNQIDYGAQPGQDASG